MVRSRSGGQHLRHIILATLLSLSLLLASVPTGASTTETITITVSVAQYINLTAHDDVEITVTRPEQLVESAEYTLTVATNQPSWSLQANVEESPSGDQLLNVEGVSFSITPRNISLRPSAQVHNVQWGMSNVGVPQTLISNGGPGPNQQIGVTYGILTTLETPASADYNLTITYTVLPE